MRKNGFTKLEVVLIFFVLLTIAGLFIYIKSSNFNIVNFFDEKTALQQRFERLNYLVDNREIGQYYDEFMPPKAKSKTGKDKFINEAINKAKKTIIYTIHSITIRGNVGYIDRTATECTDENCFNKVEKRVYKKWEFKEGNWYPKGDEYCIRDAPYNMSPEFERAISLYKQRSDQKGGPYEWRWLNCVDIQYASIPNAEGYFTFDRNSTADRLTIFVDNSYKIKDDLLTTFLLSHEFNHAYNFVYNRAEGISQPCYDAEIVAFTAQLNFLLSFNLEEMQSISSRLQIESGNTNNPLQMANELAKFAVIAGNQCGQDFNCQNKLVSEQISQMVKSSPFYQKECGIN